MFTCIFFLPPFPYLLPFSSPPRCYRLFTNRRAAGRLSWWSRRRRLRTTGLFGAIGGAYAYTPNTGTLGTTNAQIGHVTTAVARRGGNAQNQCADHSVLAQFQVRKHLSRTLPTQSTPCPKKNLYKISTGKKKGGNFSFTELMFSELVDFL